MSHWLKWTIIMITLLYKYFCSVYIFICLKTELLLKCSLFFSTFESIKRAALEEALYSLGIQKQVKK